MSQQDRGAYTPQTDAPLAFDARAPRGGRRPLPMALIGSGVVLIALIVAVVMYYRSGVRTPAGGQPAVVGQPVASVKTAPAPADEAKSEDPFSNLDVYAAQNVPASAPAAAKPTFAPSPEQPAPRSAADAGLKVQTVEPSAVHAVPGAKPEPAKPAAPAPVAPAQVAAAAPAAPAHDAAGAAPARLAPPPAKPAAVAAAKPAPAKAEVAKAEPAPAAGGAAAVQIGAFSSTALADKGFSDVAAAFPGPMAGKGKKVERLERDGKVLFRGLITGFASHASAASFCEQLKAAGRSCIVRG